jgi:hypothetical protein
VIASGVEHDLHDAGKAVIDVVLACHGSDAIDRTLFDMIVVGILPLSVIGTADGTRDAVRGPTGGRTVETVSDGFRH